MSQLSGPVVGWLSTPGTAQAWPGALLYRDAFVVRGPTDLLQAPPAGLLVDLGPLGRHPVAEILTVAGVADVAPAPGESTAMIRLLRPVAAVRSPAVDRSAVEAGFASGTPLWTVLERTGVVPRNLPAPAVRTTVATEDAPIAVKTVQGAPVDWCTIFWWLC